MWLVHKIVTNTNDKPFNTFTDGVKRVYWNGKGFDVVDKALAFDTLNKAKAVAKKHEAEVTGFAR